MIEIEVSPEETYAVANAQYEAEADHMIADPSPLTEWEKGAHVVLGRLLGSKNLRSGSAAGE